MHQLKGRKQTPEHIAKRTRDFKGKPKSDETKRKIADSLRGRPSTSSTKFKPGQAAHNRRVEDFSVHGGYRVIRSDGSAGKDWVREHALVAERALGRRLKHGEEVHHINGDKHDNKNSNLLVCSSAYHRYLENAFGFVYKRERFGGLSHELAVAELHSKFAKVGKRNLLVRNANGPSDNVCPACGESFQVGGEGHPGHATVFCSPSCKSLGRIRRATVCETLNEMDRLILAQIIDAVGTFTLTVNASESISVKLSIHIPEHRESLRAWLVKYTGLGKLGRYRSWQIYSGSVSSLIEQIIDLLKAKQAQAALALETQNRLSDPVIKSDRSWQPEYVHKMQQLNAKGGGRWANARPALPELFKSAPVGV